MKIISARQYLADYPDAGRIYPSDYSDLDVYHLNRALVFGNPPLISPIQRGSPLLTFVLEESANYGLTRRALAVNQNTVTNNFRIHDTCVLLNNMWCENFFHWMLESLPRLLIFEEKGFKGTYIIPAGVTFIRDSLALLNIATDRLVEYSEPFVAHNLLLTDRFHHSRLHNYPRLLDTLRLKLTARTEPRSETGRSDRLYIKRTQSRKIINEDALLNLIAPYGFTATTMEAMPLQHQIDMMQDVRFLLAPHGAGMVHALFMPRESVVVEMFSAKYVNPCCMHVITNLNHRYYMLTQYLNGVPPDFSSRYFDGFWIADINANLSVLKHILRHELEE